MLLDGHMADLARFFPFHRYGSVTAVDRARSVTGGEAFRWVATVECTDGMVLDRCLVVGRRVPRVHTAERPSFGLVGAFGANATDPWFIPSPWSAATLEELKAFLALDEFDSVSIRVRNDGAWIVDAPVPDSDERESRILVAENLVAMLGGSRRMARAGVHGSEEPLDVYGDAVAIDQITSPLFFAWAKWVTQALNALLTIAQDGGGPIPPGAGNPILTPYVAITPEGYPLGDEVPAIDGQGGGGAPDFPQVVGRIVTGSTNVRGK